MLKNNKKSFKELINENKQDLLKDKAVIEKIEKRIESRLETQKLA